MSGKSFADWRRGRELKREAESPRAISSLRNGLTLPVKLLLHLGVTWKYTATMANILNTGLLLIAQMASKRLMFHQKSSIPGNMKYRALNDLCHIHVTSTEFNPWQYEILGPE